MESVYRLPKAYPEMIISLVYRCNLPAICISVMSEPCTWKEEKVGPLVAFRILSQLTAQCQEGWQNQSFSSSCPSLNTKERSRMSKRFFKSDKALASATSYSYNLQNISHHTMVLYSRQSTIPARLEFVSVTVPVL